MTHPWNNFEMQRYYQNEPKFNGFYSRYNLPFVPTHAAQIEDGRYKKILMSTNQ